MVIYVFLVLNYYVIQIVELVIQAIVKIIINLIKAKEDLIFIIRNFIVMVITTIMQILF